MVASLQGSSPRLKSSKRQPRWRETLICICLTLNKKERGLNEEEEENSDQLGLGASLSLFPYYGGSMVSDEESVLLLWVVRQISYPVYKGVLVVI